MSVAEGSKVAYVGPVGQGMPGVGDRGRVLSRAGSVDRDGRRQGLHVMWVTGARTGQVDLVTDEEVVADRASASPADDFADSLTHTGSFTQVAIREVYDESGPVGLLNSLSEAGHLASLSDSAEEALQHVASRVREHQPIREVMASLDTDEADALVMHAVSMLLRDAAESEEG